MCSESYEKKLSCNQKIWDSISCESVKIDDVVYEKFNNISVYDTWKREIVWK